MNIKSYRLCSFKFLLRKGLSEPEFYDDLVYRLKKIVGSNNFSAQFTKIISYIKSNVWQQTACLVVNLTRVYNFAFLFNSTPVGRTSDSMTVPTLMRWLGPDALAVVRPTGFYLLDLFCSGIQFYVLLSLFFALSPFYIMIYML